MATTIYDVAKLAGVGLGTVSRVLNNSPAVRDSTRQRVQAAIRQLDYTPDPIARSMTRGRTGTLAVIIPFFTRPFSIEVLRGIEASTSRLGFELVVYNIENDAQRDDCFRRLPMSRKADGLLVVSVSPKDVFIPNFAQAQLPTILVDAYNPSITSVVVNNVDGSYAAMKYLLEKGHRRIGFINGQIEGNFKFNQANDRLIGVHRALGEAGINFEPELMEIGSWDRQGGRLASQRLLNLKNPPTAIFAASDVQALGTLETAKAMKLSVPRDLSIMGFDGIELSEWLELTTMQQPMYHMGELGMALLMEQIENPQKPPELIRLNTELVERSTVGSPKIRNEQ
jgi:DNA-binding LacI/PurR family transcriptional regulator